MLVDGDTQSESQQDPEQLDEQPAESLSTASLWTILQAGLSRQVEQSVGQGEPGAQKPGAMDSQSSQPHEDSQSCELIAGIGVQLKGALYLV